MVAKGKRRKKEERSFLKLVIFVSLILAGFILGVNKDKFFKTPLIGTKLQAGEEISAKELKAAIEKKDFTFINVHTPYEGEIEKTDLFLEYDGLMAAKDSLPKDKNAKIVLYCQSGNMSAQALETLKNLGYKNVSHLDGGMEAWKKEDFSILDLSGLPDQVLPKEGFELPITWGNIGPELVRLGVIDLPKFEKAVQLTDAQKNILTKGGNIPIKINSTNSQFVVDILWALGLAQKSKVYDEGPLGKEYKKDVGNFASTGGWSLAKGPAVNYLNKFDLIPLTPSQQDQVAEISKNVYRPCCGNPTWFPDCNHGMAALAAIELMVSNGMSDEEIYKNILYLNSFWFPQNYLIAATYFARQGVSWDKVDAKEVLGQNFSSGQGAAEVAKKVGPLPYGGQAGGSCGA